MKNLYYRIFGDPSHRVLKKYQSTIDEIKKNEQQLSSLSTEQLQAKTGEFKDRFAKGETLEVLLPEAFAVVREACRRLVGTEWEVRGEMQKWNDVPYDVQLLGAMVLHHGAIAEMKTGEGKTLVASIAAYLNALSGKGVHVVTVNEYLARRDSEWMGGVYRFLGLSVGVVVHGDDAAAKKAAYEADITYGTNNEFGFDYLRDNMVGDVRQRAQRPLAFAIVDEVDSILIDEARTPLIISAPAEESTEKYYQFAKLVPQLVENSDYNVDEKLKAATLTERGVARLEKMLGLSNIYEEGGVETVRHIEQSLKAHTLFQRDRDYVVKDGEVIIVDSFTGRLMPGRRYSEGLHQAIEAKENLEVRRESRTLATITFQNYFRLYKKLAGMTGTAKTEEEEFQKIYGLDVVVIPTNKTVQRQDLSDVIYKTEKAKFVAAAHKIKELHEKGQPVLVGTVSIEKNELLSRLLERMGIPHEVLNAKNNEREAKIVARAGQKGGVTIATNIAGRGTDIKLSPESREAGGLFVLGTERHESRRIDNQLRGRSGRQGDPGISQFYVSMEDDLLRLFGSDRMKMIMDRLGLPEDQPIENGAISRSIEGAQKKVEGNNFDIRKHVVEYDDVMNRHRKTIYRRRNEFLRAAEDDRLAQEAIENKQPLPERKTRPLRDIVLEIVEEEIENIVSQHTMGENENKWDMEEIAETVATVFSVPADFHAQLIEIEKKVLDRAAARTKLVEFIKKHAEVAYAAKEQEVTPAVMRQIERVILLRSIDSLWIEHLDAMEHLREGVRLRGYGQKDPLVEFKREGFGAFQRLQAEFQKTVTNNIFKVKIAPNAAPTPTPMQQAAARENRGESGDSPQAKKAEPVIGRNDLCPCGSGKKYKKCHGK